MLLFHYRDRRSQYMPIANMNMNLMYMEMDIFQSYFMADIL